MKPSHHRLPSLRALPLAAAIGAAIAGLVAPPAIASSHREAPFITTAPKVDGTDFYMFRSYEPSRLTGEKYVTLIANYQPLQAPYGGPNYFAMDPNALYEIHIDNDGDAREDISFRFRFHNRLNGFALPIGGSNVAIPLIQQGPVSAPADPNLNVSESYTLAIVRGDRRGGRRESISNAANGKTEFDKPVDNIGTKTIADYAAYAARHVYDIDIPGCASKGRVFVGQRQDGFAVNLGPIFDLVNAPLAVITDPTKINVAPGNSIQDSNVTSLALEVPVACLIKDANSPVIGAWTTASLRQGSLLDPSPKPGIATTRVGGGAWTQVSRLGMPLVNEVVIGLHDKDRFNSSKPKDDAQFAAYVTNPTLPKLISIAFAKDLGGADVSPTNIPRTDLVATFLTGIKGLNQPAHVVPSEMLRLNTAIDPVPFDQQNRLGVVGNLLAKGNDNAGFPNGRRPKDDVVDISLVAAMGGLCLANGDNDALGFGTRCRPSAVPLGATALKLHDGVDQAQVPFLPGFPYLNTPLPGAH